jgi:hypothetical protein
MVRVMTSEDLRARLKQELNSLRAAKQDMVDRVEFLEDSIAALQARDEVASSVPWTEVRTG